MDSSITMLLKETLEFMHNTKDVDELSNIFSSLGIYLLSKDTSKEMVIKSEQIYEKIFLLLNNRSQKKKLIALNLISALFISIDEDEPSHMYIQNMIRISGCLKAMSELFTSVVLLKDTSSALCTSLSEACRGSSPNQWYCTHLVPICIKKCQQHREMFSVLQSLLFKHKRNTRLFHQCKGMTIFTSDTLENEDCLQLLNIVVENTEGENKESIRKASHLFDHLQYLLQTNHSSMISKWASIILYSYCKGYLMMQNEGEVNNECDKKTNNNSNENDTNPMITYDTQKELFSNETNVLFKNILNEIIISKKHEKMGKDQQRHFEAIQKNSCENIFNEHVTELNHFSTHGLMNELASKSNERLFSDNRTFKQKEQGKSDNISRTQIESTQKYSYSQPTDNFKNERTALDRFATNISIRKSAPSEVRNERSFSIIHKNISLTQRKYSDPHLSVSKTNFMSANKCESVLDDSLFLRNQKQQNESNYHNRSIHSETDMNRDGEFLVDFSPHRSSTPFINSVDKYNDSSKTFSQNGTRYIKSRKNKRFTVKSSVSRTGSTNKKMRDTVKSKINKTKRNETLTKSSPNKSMTSRFLDLVNISCTTIAKSFITIKNIFKTDNKEESVVSQVVFDSKSSCNYSFTNFMHEKDKERDETKNDNLEPSSCNTCDNTIAWNQKLVNDYSLQKTINILKRGIILYGSDFKTISRTMWPRDKSMTPKVLEKLYRKLIMK